MSNNYSKWGREWGSSIKNNLQNAGFHSAFSIYRSERHWKLLAVNLNFLFAVAWCAVPCDCWNRKREALIVNMGGDPVTTEPTILKVDEDVRSILEDFSINEGLIVEVYGLPDEGEGILAQTLGQGGNPSYEVSYPGRKIPTMKAGKGKAPLHQGVMKLLVDFEKDRRGAMMGPLKGGFSRLSGTLVSKAQLLLRLAPLSPMPKFRDTVSDPEDDSLKFLEEDHTTSEMGNFGEGGNSPKVVDVALVTKGPAKAPDRTQSLIELSFEGS
eukprot:Gb_03668 [translate_table: standard]